MKKLADFYTQYNHLQGFKKLGNFTFAGCVVWVAIAIKNIPEEMDCPNCRKSIELDTSNPSNNVGLFLFKCSICNCGLKIIKA